MSLERCCCAEKKISFSIMGLYRDYRDSIGVILGGIVGSMGSIYMRTI